MRLTLSTAPAGTAAPLVLQGEALGHAYGAQASVFEGVSLGVRAREIVVLLGSSGCGKSTLLRALAGLAPPTTGAVRFLGEPLLAPHPRSAVLFQQPGLLPWLDVARNVGFGLDFRHQPHLPQAVRRARVDAALDAVGLGQRQSLWPSQLSGGMAQRVALARALAREPVLLLADEPFSALDAVTRTQMQALLVELVHRWHTAALLVTHDIDEAIRVADRILLMGPPAPGEPARLLREWQVRAPHPRGSGRDGAATAALRDDILAALHHGHAPALIP
ncbi:MAG: ABC transporter ATP-binding protein [Hydrogenophaga sp.]|uniref:ABC transporter ATP-binding protein n=1 Tax=Hydrogenophaga sp. TaxID=1904254 RepID=UPI00257A49A7|nr:ABC transporter ATP-binding protein [Hydrogenophaga sp.]MBL0946261.1 ABC transporter ATP-binding protein [Hydrogenophaga sp.]